VETKSKGGVVLIVEEEKDVMIIMILSLLSSEFLCGGLYCVMKILQMIH